MLHLEALKLTEEWDHANPTYHQPDDVDIQQ